MHVLTLEYAVREVADRIQLKHYQMAFKLVDAGF